MAQITLGSGESFTVAGGVNTISGTTAGDETVEILGGVHFFTADFNAGGDRVALAGSSSEYTFQRSGSSVILRGPNGIVVTFPAPNPNLPAARNPVLSFAVGGDYVLDSTTAGVFTLGNAAMTYTITTTPGNFLIEPPAPIFIGVTAMDAVNAGDTVVFTLTLTQPYASAVTLDVAPIGGTAIPGIDFLGVPETLIFSPGQTVKFVTYRTVADLVEEGRETIALQLSSSQNVLTTAGSDTVATIFENTIFDYFPAPLSIGADTYPDGPGRYFGALAPGQTGKLLAADDVLVGSGAGSLIRVLQGDEGSAIADADFTGVTNIGTLQTNVTTIRLGAQADRAGIVALQTQLFVDGANSGANGVVRSSALLDLTADADANGIADFDNPLAALLANSAVDTVRMTLQSDRPSTIDTGMTFSPAIGRAIGPIDVVEFVGQATPVRLTLAPADVGNGTPYEAGTQILSVRAQATDDVGMLIGGGTRFDDEGVRFGGASFTIDDGTRLTAGFGEVILGTGLAEMLVARGAAPAYIVGGLGNDQIVGGAGADTLIGGGGRDVFIFFGASQSRGSSYDTIADFTYGTDLIELPGAARSVARVAAGPLNAAALDGDLTALLGSALTAGGAVLVTALGGTLSGATFLVADGNGVAGYQTGEDFVIRLPEPPPVLPGVFIV